MKQIISPSALNRLLQRIALLGVVLAVWYYCFPDTLSHFEETDFWTDAHDTTNIIWQWPRDWAAITAAYIQQFFQDRFWGAAILAIAATLVLLACDLIVWRMFRDCRLLWLSFIPAALTALVPTANDTLEPTVRIVVIAWCLAIVATAVTVKWHLSIPKGNKWLAWTGALLPWLALPVIALALRNGSDRLRTEQTLHIEQLAATRQWDALYDLTYPKRNELTDNEMSYALLALSQKGLLAEKLFTFPLKGMANIFTHGENYRFNSYFCHELGLPNEAIRYAFEEGQYMPAGASFGSIRRMVDWLQEKGDDPQLVEYYLNLLSHSSCHRDFIISRRIRANNTPTTRRQTAPTFVGTDIFVYEAAVALENDPANTRARDYLLCGLLMMGQTEAFYRMFQQSFFQQGTTQLPLHYREALLMLKPRHPEIEVEYALTTDLEKRYRQFTELAAKGAQGREEAIRRYAGTYWAYILNRQEADNTPAPTKENAVGPAFGY